MGGAGGGVGPGPVTNGQAVASAKQNVPAGHDISRPS